MAPLPYSRTVDVTVTRQDKFPTRDGFGVVLIVVSVTVAGVLDAANRTKVYSSIQEVTADWGPTTEPYKAALAIFSRNPRPLQIKMGYRNPANAVVSELNLIEAADRDWYWLTFTKEFNDSADAALVAAWAEARTCVFGIGTNDIDTENPGSTAHISHALKTANYVRTAGFYHTDANVYLAQSAFGYGASRDLDRANYDLARLGRIDSGQAYTMKFKDTPGIPAINKASAAVQGITGFIPGLGLDPAQGHLANTVVNIGGRAFLVEGNTYGRAWIDEMHSLDWIRARMQESILGVLLNTARIPMTNTGNAFLIEAGIKPPLRRAVAAGIIASEFDAGSGDFREEFTITVDRIENIPVAQRASRIAPDIKIDLRMAGAIHYASASITAKF
jgi:hypothetical protein